MTNTFIQFGPYKDFKPTKPVSTVRYKYPWDKITKTGQEYGFFVGVDKKPKAPPTLKCRAWRIVPAEHNGQKGFYVYVHQFTNGFAPPASPETYYD